MKYITITFWACVIALSGCSNNTNESKKNIVSVPSPKSDNLFDRAAFEKSNAKFSKGTRFSDSDVGGYSVLKTGVYTTNIAAAFQVCARLIAFGANPGLRVRGNDGALLLTAIPDANGADVGLIIGGGEGTATLVDGKTCVTTSPLTVGSDVTVYIYPAINNSGRRFDKTATGELLVENISVKWLAK